MKFRTAKFILPFLLCFAQYTYAGSIDSLERQLHVASSDQDKALLLFIIGDRFVGRNNDSALMYLKQAGDFGKKAGNDSLVMESIVSTAYALDGLNKYAEAKEHFERGLVYAHKLNNPRLIMDYSAGEAFLLNEMKLYYQSIALCKEVLPTAIQGHYSKAEARLYSTMGEGYACVGSYATALDLISKSAYIFDSLKIYRSLAQCYMSISMLYSRQKEYKEALKYAEITDSLYKKDNNEPGHYSLKINEGILFKNMGEYDRAISTDMECMKFFKDDSTVLTYIYTNLGIAQSMKGELQKAKQSLFTAFSIFKIYPDAAGEVDACKELGKIYLKTGQIDSALYYSIRSRQICLENKRPQDELKGCLEVIFEAYEKKGDIANALKYHKEYEAVQDTMYNNLETSRYAEVETRFNVAEKNKELNELSAENELQKVKADQQHLLNVLLVSGLCLGIIIVLLIINAYKRTLKKNRLLSEQQQALLEQKRTIDDQVVQLDNAAKMKSKFLANISHELRTPVTLLTGMLELMSKKNIDDIKEKERLNVAYNNSRKLQHMVEEILDLTKLENNVSQPVYEVKEIAPLLKRIVYTFETLIEKEHLILQYDDAAAKGLNISIDPIKFEKIINNLVYNAIKFNSKGGYVNVTVYPSADRSHVCIDVRDSGIGISPEDMPHIFDHFYQGSTTGLKADGAGIGLSLVKEFTLLMGGTIDVKSKKGEGTTFAMQFLLIDAPKNIDPPEEKMGGPMEDWGNFPRKQTVLIVEDNEEMRYYLKEVLGEKVNIATAVNGKEGLAWLANHMPDLVISDVMMPEMDGREFINILKNDERYKKLPVITLTALADIENQLSFLRMGIDDYIVKPFNADELRVRVYNLLTNQAERRIYNEQPVEPGDIQADSKDAEAFRTKITEYVLAKLKDTNVSVFDLAYELSMSERQLYRLAKSLTGCTPAQLIKEVRLQKAYQLLLSGDIYKIEDVARRVGFEKASYFSQQFFERFGKRPSEFL